ncbi:hypothetical protein KNN17_20145 [Arthrobacter bambusae]|jgi:hypothetical protein|uniref:hypothetical protein n=1 Tax=Arthrobacter TaxID=1663 RepID=UPI001F50F11C|nr:MULTISPECIES: hypothetical protein [Arthrobacter]MCI0143878.1 hypothetical protein [Arthrobacter bambusae]UYY82037.1 hypothetical protein OIT41_02890 [Arthrobacter sp. YA7-1]
MSTTTKGLESTEEHELREVRETLGAALATAQEHLEQNGGFLPFAVTLDEDDELRIVFVTPGEPDDEGSVDTDLMLADILELLRQGRDEYRAVAIASDVILPEHGSDGIHAAAEHRGGRLMAAVVPYVRTAEGFTFDNAEGDTNEPLVWVD